VEGFGDQAAFKAALGTRGAECTERDRSLLVTVSAADGAHLVLEAAAESDYALRRLQKRNETLEDVFFRLVDEPGEAH